MHSQQTFPPRLGLTAEHGTTQLELNKSFQFRETHTPWYTSPACQTLTITTSAERDQSVWSQQFLVRVRFNVIIYLIFFQDSVTKLTSPYCVTSKAFVYLSWLLSSSCTLNRIMGFPFPGMTRAVLPTDLAGLEISEDSPYLILPLNAPFPDSLSQIEHCCISTIMILLLLLSTFFFSSGWA